MKVFLPGSLLLASVLVALAPSPTQAQEISLAQLVNLTELHDGKKAEMNEWTFRPATPPTAEEGLTWSWWPAAEPGTRLPLAQLTMRPAVLGFDVVLSVKRLALYKQLRRELERQHLSPVPVTCLGAACSGQRFTATGYTVAFYEDKPGDYPFVIVVQPKPSRPSGQAASLR